MNEKVETIKKEVKSPDEKCERKGEKKEKFCKDCKWFDKSSEREFHRLVGKKDEKGQRTEIVEIRAICRNSKAKAHGHLVMSECLRRQCPQWKEGTYISS